MATLLHWVNTDLPPLPEAGLNWRIETGCVTQWVCENRRITEHLSRRLMGIEQPARGEILWQGRPIQPLDRSRIGFIFPRPLQPSQLKTGAYLRAFAHGMGLSYAMLRPSFPEGLELPRLENLRIDQLDRLQVRLVKLALSLLSHPMLLWLDGLFDGLNDYETRYVRELIHELSQREGTSLVILTDRLNLDLGISVNLCLTGPSGVVAKLRSEKLDTLPQRFWEVKIRPEQAPRAAVLLEEAGVTHYQIADPETLLIENLPGREPDSADINAALVRAGLDVRELRGLKQSRADVLRRLLEESEP